MKFPNWVGAVSWRSQPNRSKIHALSRAQGTLDGRSYRTTMCSRRIYDEEAKDLPGGPGCVSCRQCLSRREYRSLFDIVAISKRAEEP